MVTGINFILFDAARLKQQMGVVKALNPGYLSLYEGRREIDLEDVGPYLSAFETGKKFAVWYKETGWGNSWGFLVKSTSNMETLLQHFQKFLLIKNEDGNELYFRFYDPRVLRIFLPTCDEQQLLEFFGPVQQFICEDENPDFALVCSFNGRKLMMEKVNADTLFSAPAEPGKQEDNIPALATGTITRQGEPVEVKPRRRFFD